VRDWDSEVIVSFVLMYCQIRSCFALVIKTLFQLSYLLELVRITFMEDSGVVDAIFLFGIMEL